MTAARDMRSRARRTAQAGRGLGVMKGRGAPQQCWRCGSGQPKTITGVGDAERLRVGNDPHPRRDRNDVGAGPFRSRARLNSWDRS